jgi:hypothetical protein
MEIEMKILLNTLSGNKRAILLLLCSFIVNSKNVCADINVKKQETIESLGTASLNEEAAKIKGLEIANEGDRRDTGFENVTAHLTMLLIEYDGTATTRNMLRKTLEVKDDGDKNLNIFESPEDIRGTAVLTYSHANEADEQWILFPSLKRVKRISTSNKSGQFMGSEFSFEDIAPPELSKYTYRFLKEDMQEGKKCFVLELVPTYKYSGYTKLIQWLDQEMYQPLKTEYYDKSEKHFKTLYFRSYRQYLGKYWRPSEMVMENSVNKKTTKLLWNDYTFKSGLSENDFSVMALNR